MKEVYGIERIPEVARQVLEETRSYRAEYPHPGALVIGLSGDLGAGKTTLMQAIASSFGIPEAITSPTFVIAKWYGISIGPYKTLVHIDAYRIESEDELAPINFGDIIADPKGIVFVEWPEKIAHALGQIGAFYFTIDHTGEMRTISGPFLYK